MSKNGTSEIIIIGGGVIGLAAARELSLRGVKDITVIERGDFGAEASWAAGGMLAPQSEAECADDFFRLAVASRDLYPELADALMDETGIEIELDRAGTLYLAFSDRDESALDARYRWQAAAGLPVQRLTSAETHVLEPAVSPGVRGALLFPLDHQVENRSLVRALLAACERRGVRLLRATEATAINIAGGRVDGISTGAETFAAEKIVIAGGSWSSSIAFSDGRQPPFAVEPVRGQMLCYQADISFARRVIYSSRGYLVPRRDGRVLAGSTSEWIGFDKSVTPDGLESITAQSIEIAPLLSGLPLIGHWSGLRPRSADGLPVVGELDELPGLFYATGHYRNGILLAPITAFSLGTEITTGIRPELMRPFNANRSSLGKVVVHGAHG